MSTITTIFNGDTNPAGITLSEFFEEPTFLYLIAPDINPKEFIEVDCFLNIFLIDPKYGEINRLVRLERFILDNLYSLTVPQEYKETGHKFQIGLISSKVVRLEINVVDKGCSKCSVQEDTTLDDIIRTVKNISDVASVLLPYVSTAAGFILKNSSPYAIAVSLGLQAAEDFIIPALTQQKFDINYNGDVFAKLLDAPSGTTIDVEAIQLINE